MIGGDAVAVGGAEAAGGPFASDGGAELGDELGITWRGCCGRRRWAGGDELFNPSNLLGSELGEGLVACDKIVEHSFLVGGCSSQGIHP